MNWQIPLPVLLGSLEVRVCKMLTLAIQQPHALMRASRR